MDSPSRVLLPINKSITKSNPTSNKKEEIKVEKKYKTYSNTVKRQYLHELWKGLIELFNPTYSLHFELELPESEDFLNLFDQTTLQQKNRLLKNILTSHGEDFTEKSLIDWRKKIRSWIEKINKPETRGAPVVPVEKAGDFKKRVEEILDHIPCRSESLLKSELLKVLKSYHDELEGSGKPFNVNTCSKHWWFNYRERNPDIREKWEAIPLERVLNKKTSAKSRTQGRASATISTAGVSLETSPARGEDQSHFDRFHLEMEEEKDEKAQFTLFDEVEGSDYNVNYVKQFAYLFQEDFGANNTEYDIDQFFADMNEDVASGQVYLDSPKY